jgi:hypothetical protein
MLCVLCTFVFILISSLFSLSNKHVVEPKGIKQTALISLKEKHSIIECASNLCRLVVCVIIGSQLLAVHILRASSPGHTYTLLLYEIISLVWNMTTNKRCTNNVV